VTAFRLGMPTLIELADLDANVALCRDLGLAFVELNMNLPQFCPESLPAERLCELRDETGVDFTLHLPEELDLGAFNRHIREGHLACLTAAVAWAGDAGIPVVNLHLNMGVYFTLPDRRVWLYEKHQDVFLANLEASLREVLEVACGCDVIVCIENGGGDFGFGFIREAVERMLALDEARIGLTWDLGHDASSGFAAKPVFEKHTDRIRHMHLHDCDGTRSHQVLFTGEVDVPSALALARRLDVGVVIETKTPEALKESVSRLAERGRL